LTAATEEVKDGRGGGMAMVL